MLAGRLSFVHVEKPLHFLLDEEGMDNYIRVRDYVNTQDDRIFTSWFYGLGNIYTYHRFKGADIITDRHLVSNFLWSGTDESRPVFDCLVQLIGKPDHTFLLYARSEAIGRRLRNRDQSDPDLNKADLTEWAYDKMERFLRDYEMPYTRIDTSEMAPAEVVEAICASGFVRKEIVEKRLKERADQ
jgi:hypothetical protein